MSAAPAGPGPSTSDPRTDEARTTLYGLDLAAAAARTGHLGQVARVEDLTDANGPARGSRRLRLVTGGGLELDLHPDRALDLGQITVDGVPLAWTSPAGFAAPGLAQRDDFGATFAGGLLTTCGLDHIGAPVVDDGRSFPQHGRVGLVPATVERAAVVDDALVVEATVRQATLHEENLLLRRTVRAPLGSTRVVVEDVVTNAGARPEKHLVLYHCNLGWPLLAEDAELSVDSHRVVPDGPDAEQDPWADITAPEAGYRQRVHRHDLDRTQGATATLTNRRLGLRLRLTVDTTTLPVLYQWKMFAPGQNVLGLEPASSPHLGGRVAAPGARPVPVLAPGEIVRYTLTFDVDRL